MRLLGRIAYWLASIALLAAILVSLDYTLVQAVLIGLIFCPCALALEYLMPKARKPMDKVYLSLATLVTVIVLIIILHHGVWSTIVNGGMLAEKQVAPMLINPAFLGLILTALVCSGEQVVLDVYVDHLCLGFQIKFLFHFFFLLSVFI